MWGSYAATRLWDCTTTLACLSKAQGNLAAEANPFIRLCMEQYGIVGGLATGQAIGISLVLAAYVMTKNQENKQQKVILPSEAIPWGGTACSLPFVVSNLYHYSSYQPL